MMDTGLFTGLFTGQPPFIAPVIGYPPFLDAPYQTSGGALINAAEHGAVADASQDAGTGEWTGTSQTALFQLLAAEAAASAHTLFYPPGDYFMDGGLFPDPVNYSNLHIAGAGDQTRFVIKDNVSVFRLIGEADNEGVSIVWLTANAPAGSRTLTINDTSTLFVGEWITIKDNAQPVYSADNAGSIPAPEYAKVATLGEVNRIQSIDSATKITLRAYTQFAYTFSGTPGAAGVVRRWMAPATNIQLADFSVVFDPTTAFTTTNRGIEVQRAAGVRVDRVRIYGGNIDGFAFNDVVNFNITDCADLDGGADHYGMKLSNGCSRFLIDGWRCRNARHAITTTTSATAIEVQNGVIRNAIGEFTNLACFDSHPGSRDILWEGCVAVGAGDSNLDNGHGEGAGFQMRGRRQTLVHPQVNGYHYGIVMAFGDHQRVLGGQFENCQKGAIIQRSPYSEIDASTIFRDIRETVVEILAMEDVVTHEPLPGLILRGQVQGATPTGITLDEGVQGSDWVVDLDMPDVVTPLAGNMTRVFRQVLDSNGRKNLTGGWTQDSWNAGTVSSGNFRPDPLQGNIQHYVNDGAHTLLPPAAPSKVLLESRNGASAGAVATTLFNAVSGASFSTGAGKRHLFEIEKTKTVARVNIVTMPGISAWSTIQGLGLSSGCKLCLDAGDSASYSGSGTVWTDRSGGSPGNFNFGAAGAAPTFAGTAGELSQNEYLSFDGGGYLTYGAANAAWMQTLHQNSVSVSIVMLVYFVSSSLYGYFGDDGGGAGVGMEIYGGSSGPSLAYAARTTGGVVSEAAEGPAITTNQWTFAAVSIDEADNVADFRLNNAILPRSFALFSPSAANAAYTMQIGAAGNNTRIVPSGTRIAVVCAFTPRLTNAQVANLLSILGPRWDIT